MAIGMTVTPKDAEHVTTKISLTGLTVGTKYDVVRLHLDYHLNSAGVPVYERFLPDKREYWSAVQHRVSWTATTTTHNLNDYETPLQPVQYFLVETAQVGPFQHDFKTAYPTSRGFLSPTVVHYWWSLRGTPADKPGLVRIRSTATASVWHDACVVEMGDLKYTARGSELAVMGNQYPVFVGDVREQRRGSIVVKCSSLAEVLHLQNIVFPTSGVIRPIIFDSASEPSLIISRMVVVPLDVTIEQATTTDASLRYLHIDFVEIDPTAPLWRKTKENIVTPADAMFTIRANGVISSPPTVRVKQSVVVTDTSTGQYDGWHWYFPGAYEGMVYTPENPGVPFRKAREPRTQGPHEVYYLSPGKYPIKLWIGDRTGLDDVNTGADSIRRYITVTR